MKAPCLNVCVANKDDQRYSVICDIKNILFAHLGEGASPVIRRISMFSLSMSKSISDIIYLIPFDHLLISRSDALLVSVKFNSFLFRSVRSINQEYLIIEDI